MLLGAAFLGYSGEKEVGKPHGVSEGKEIRETLLPDKLKS